MNSGTKVKEKDGAGSLNLGYSVESWSRHELDFLVECFTKRFKCGKVELCWKKAIRKRVA